MKEHAPSLSYNREADNEAAVAADPYETADFLEENVAEDIEAASYETETETPDQVERSERQIIREHLGDRLSAARSQKEARQSWKDHLRAELTDGTYANGAEQLDDRIRRGSIGSAIRAMEAEAA